MKKIIDVVAGIIEHDGKIVLACRPDTGDQAGYWEFPGGKVEANESQSAALVRELQEELGITARPQAWVATQHWEVSGRIIALHAWHVPHFTGTPVALCHTALVWCSLSEAQDYADKGLLAPADIPLLAAFNAVKTGQVS